MLGRTFGSDKTNIVDLYLGQRGWAESAADREYLAGLSSAAPSLFEVSQIVPGRSMVVRDLLNASDPVTVREKNATRSLKPWDRIAVRVVKLGDNHVISGAVLQFSSEAAQLLLHSLRPTLGLGPRQTLTLREDQKRGCAPLFANAWLFTQLPNVLSPELPTLTNSNGDPLEFRDLRFPFAAGFFSPPLICAERAIEE